MKKWILTAVTLTAMVAIIAAFPAASQEDIQFVKDGAFAAHMRPPVSFNHNAHNETAGIEDCSVCHHVFQNGERVEDETSIGSPCSECHTLEKGENPMSLVRVYHLQCKGCHLEKKAGPVLCGECHRR